MSAKTTATPRPAADPAAATPTENFPARAARWSASHRKRAVLGWLAFVVRRRRLRPARRTRRRGIPSDAGRPPTRARNRPRQGPARAPRDAWRKSVLAQPLERHTSRTLTDPRDLAHELARPRTCGHAADHGEHHEDVHAIAAAVFQGDDAVAALAVSLTAADHATADAAMLAAQTHRVATAIA